MPTDHRAALANIRTFPSLIRYLRDEMGWPIDGKDFEELTFEYTPEELGIDPKNAAKIEEIKRLRPLSANQPWGIFFIKFEPKRLPVVALRRILSQVVLKKRASANSAERTAWAADDLLFVSNYGEGEERKISFAHFSQPEGRQDLPTLKVLGWDTQDTPLHLDGVAVELTRKLAWPEDDEDVATWRSNWRSAFSLRHREVVTTSRALSFRLADLARAIRDRIKIAIAIETERGALTQLMKAFQTLLVHDLNAGGFADTYAQTIAYGLLSARITDPKSKTADDFTTHMRTSPLLKELMQTFLHVGGRRGTAGGPGIDFDELGVSDVVELLDDPSTHIEAVVRDFGDRNPQEDPVIHFYELFLREYDAKQRIRRGVFYTPRPVVSYIVRSVDELLRTEFGLTDGLADTATWGEIVERLADLKIPDGVDPTQAFVQILDPAVGTGTFLVEVIDVIHNTLIQKWQAQGHRGPKIEALWNDYVPKHLLTRLHGYELLMAPYAIAHLKIGLKLYETGYRFGSDERARIYLTNTLEPWARQPLLTGFDALAHEATAVNDIKRATYFTVVLGNPPYSNFGQLNRNTFILGLLESYKRGLDEKKLNLDDDFIKFFRFSQALIQTSGCGVLGLITNNVYLDGITHRRMRQSFLETFSRVYVLDLHGSAKKLETSRAGVTDQNVFEIQQGVCISLLVKSRASAECIAYHRDLRGTRESKYNALGSTHLGRTSWVVLEPAPPHFFFVPKNLIGQAEYESFAGLSEIFGIFQNGIKTDRDDLFFDFDRCELEARIRKFYSKEYDPEFSKRFAIRASSSYDIEARRDQTRFSPENIHRCLYRPFDFRWLYYDPNLTSRAANKVMRHQLYGENVALVCLRQTRRNEEGAFLVSRDLINKDAVSLFDIGTVFPLYLYEERLSFDGADQNDGNTCRDLKHDNFVQRFVDTLATKLQIARQDAVHTLSNELSPQDIFNYVYAVFHSPGYRSRYAEFLKIDFPRVPLPGSINLFRKVSRIGSDLIALHLMEAPRLERSNTTYAGPQNPEVRQIGWSNDTVWLDAFATDKGQPTKRGTVGFRGIPEAVWQFHIGGYQVCEKWLKDRKGRALSEDDIAHYQKIVVALAETIRLMREIDEVIELYGGWPGAFAQRAAEARETAGTDNVVPLPHPKSAMFARQAARLPLQKVAEPEAQRYESADKSAHVQRASIPMSQTRKI